MSDNRMYNILTVPNGGYCPDIRNCGYEKCLPGHDFGPAVRDHYLIHYVIQGEGVFSDGARSFRLKAGSLFLIVPNRLTVYRADDTNPWEYIWVGFSGADAGALLSGTGLSEDNPVLHHTGCRDFFTGMIGNVHDPEERMDAQANSLRIQGELLRAAAHLVRKNNQDRRAESRVSDRVRDFIKNNLGNRVSITRLASDFGYSRTHFSELFRRETGIPPREFLISCRIEQASRLLVSTDIKISDIARSVGYDDALLFSRQFKSRTGQSPRVYRDEKRIKELNVK